MIRFDRHRCEACGVFMPLEEDMLPLHLNEDGAFCPGSDTEDYEESRRCGCGDPNANPPCSNCERNLVDGDDGEPDPAECQHIMAAGRCGMTCPLLCRALCPTPEVPTSKAASSARVLDQSLLGIFGDLAAAACPGPEQSKPFDQLLADRQAAHDRIRGVKK